MTQTPPDDPPGIPPDAPALRVLGVRHHGPGSARSVRRALEAQRPEVVLVEGPSDADPLLPYVPRLVPPVALLGWRREDPARSAFWPFAVFSPEWQALDWAVEHGVPVRFIDLPTWAVLTPDADPPPAADAPDHPEDAEPDAAGPQGGGTAPGNPGGLDHEPGDPPAIAAELSGEPAADEGAVPASAEQVRQDPIARLARAAGYDDPEAWWEDVIELGSSPTTGAEATGTPEADPFDALTEAMAELRRQTPEDDAETLLREAHMRRALRAATKEFGRVAVVCGAWHAPALSGKLPPASADNALLRQLPSGAAARRATEVTWAPWTHSRLAQASGYGAGITSPGWYHHLFTVPDQPIARWLTHVAGVLREHDLPVSSAHIIESVRLAEALATLRGRPLPGLPEVTEATWSVMCEANPLVLDLVTREAVVGEALGEVPDDVPMVPLDADLRATAKRLRLRFEASEKTLTLDLRKPLDLDRSRLFHRLGILGVDWAEAAEVRGQGTFKEGWTLAWRPELSVRVVVANRHGNTVVQAATHRLVDAADSLAEVTAAVEQALVAELPDALGPLLRLLDERAAQERDVVRLLQAVPPLVRGSRYGDVRHTDTDRLATVARDVLTRACAGFGAAASGINDDQARILRSQVDSVQAVVGLLGDEPERLWRETLVAALDRSDLPGVLAGRLTRLLADSGVLDPEQVSARVSRALSPGHPVEWQAAWIEGFLAGSALLVLHDPRLLRTLDDWVRHIADEAFIDALPMVRRAFAQWDAAARRQLGARVAALSRTAAAPEPTSHDDLADADGVLATVALILGGVR